MQINQKKQLGSEIDHQPRILVRRNKAFKPQAVKTCSNCSSKKNSQPHRGVCWRDPEGPRTYTNPPTQESAPTQGQICLWVAGEVTENQQKAEQAVSFPLGPSPTKCATMQPRGWPRPDGYLKLHPLIHNRCTETKKYGPNERTYQNSRKKKSKR